MDLFPAWKNAVKVLLEDGLTFGSTVSRQTIIHLCNIKPAENVEDVRRHDLEVLRCLTEIKETLLTAHSMLLVSDNNGSYIVVRPEDQTKYAVDTGLKSIAREMRKMAMGVSFTRTDLLSDADRAKNADAQAKIAALGGMIGPVKSDLLKITD